MPEVQKFLLSIDSLAGLPGTISSQTTTDDPLHPVKIPNQCWQGYYDLAEFNNSVNKPSLYTEYRDFGKSIWWSGCAICSALGAINYLLNADYTVLDAYKKGMALIYKNTNTLLVSFRRSNKFGVNSTDTQHIAYDIGRNYGWAKNSKNYYNTSSIITESKINSYKNLFYRPDGTYHQANGPYTSGTAADLLSYQGGAYCAAQAQAIERIKNDVAQGLCDIIYINSPIRNCGHYVLAIAYSQAHSSYYSFDDIYVWDPCPINIKNVYDNKKEYYGRRMTLTESMKRINCEISDGIRTIQTCTRI